MSSNNSISIPESSKVHEKYKVGRILGNGGMGVVCSVVPKNNPNVEYALKYRYNDFNETSKRRFLDEIKLLSKINSEHFPKLIDSYSDKNEQFYIMELVTGETLKDLLRKNRQLNVATANNYIRQIADALGELHSNGIIHRDIKSQNIMVQNDFYIKILDLGISVSEDSHRYTKTNAIVCSPHYVAPEYLIKNSKITKAVDIYSLGILYYEMLIGDYPFEGKNETDTILMHKNNEFPNPKNYRDLPQSIANIIIKATAKNPSHRHQTVWEFKEDVKTSLKDYRKLEKPISQKTMKSKKTIVDIINSIWFMVGVLGFLVIIVISIIIIGFTLGVL
ncbi:serine/threonine-protein kinase [Mycoplasmopsis canis]|uniref:serine/threonine-protein kinase n=1 Tax=Mycoplasmopsis canis TaxID=29555 RepID=UPI00025B05E1|nr:serine/threonine-protein kinase [Mycoplasmopsis canis]EIE39394.1 serine/threonine-protein kinase [Mycoplasmopsis canis UF33]